MIKEAMKQIIAEIDALPEGLEGYFSDAFADNLATFREALKQEQGEPWGHGGRPMTLRECMEAEEPKQGHSFTYAQMKEQVEGLQRDYDLLLAEYNLLKQELKEPVAYPEGDVVGACICGSWTGGKCLKCPRIATPQPAQKPLTDELIHEAIGTAGVDLLGLAKLWSDNEIHVYQFDNEAQKIIKAVLLRAHGIKE